MTNEFLKLVQAVKNVEDMDDKEFFLDMIEMKVKSFISYTERVYNMTTLTPILYARYEGSELRDKIMELDDSRRKAHESAIAACSALNRLCDMVKVEKFCPETDDRYIIADFIGEFVYEIYKAGTSDSGHVHSMDDMIEEMSAGHVKLERKEIF